MKLEQKRAVITGATQGLGRALARRFAAEGAELALCARNAKDLELIAIELADTGGKVVTVPCDISNSSQVQTFAETILAAFGSVDIVVNNASRLGTRVPIQEYPLPVWDEVIQTNVHGTFFVARQFIPSMIAKKSGCILNVSSSVGKAGRKLWGAYAVSKFALEGLTQVLADELKQFNIRANAINPGPMATAMRKSAYPDEDQSLLRTPDQLTDIFVYLASDDGAGISGQTFDAATYIANPRVT